MYREYLNLHRNRKFFDEDKARLAAALARFDTLAEQKPVFYATIHSRFGGDYSAYVDALYDTSIFTNGKRLKNFLKHSTKEALQADLIVQHEIGMELYETYILRVKLAGLTPDELAVELERLRCAQAMERALEYQKYGHRVRVVSREKRRSR